MWAEWTNEAAAAVSAHRTIAERLKTCGATVQDAVSRDEKYIRATSQVCRPCDAGTAPARSRAYARYGRLTTAAARAARAGGRTWQVYKHNDQLRELDVLKVRLRDRRRKALSAWRAWLTADASRASPTGPTAPQWRCFQGAAAASVPDKGKDKDKVAFRSAPNATAEG